MSLTDCIGSKREEATAKYCPVTNGNTKPRHLKPILQY